MKLEKVSNKLNYSNKFVKKLRPLTIGERVLNLIYFCNFTREIVIEKFYQVFSYF